jgi:hypothetical protein
MKVKIIGPLSNWVFSKDWKNRVELVRVGLGLTETGNLIVAITLTLNPNSNCNPNLSP